MLSKSKIDEIKALLPTLKESIAIFYSAHETEQQSIAVHDMTYADLYKHLQRSYADISFLIRAPKKLKEITFFEEREQIRSQVQSLINTFPTNNSLSIYNLCRPLQLVLRSLIYYRSKENVNAWREQAIEAEKKYQTIDEKINDAERVLEEIKRIENSIDEKDENTSATVETILARETELTKKLEFLNQKASVIEENGSIKLIAMVQ